jgi:hypothetical protein
VVLYQKGYDVAEEPVSKFKGNKEYPTPEAAADRRRRRAARIKISDALHALRPQPPAGIIQSLLDSASENDSPEIVVAKAKEYGYGT